MINKVYSLLQTVGIPLDHDFRPDFNSNKMVLSYHLFGEGTLKHGDGKPIVEGGSVQIDLFVKHETDYLSVKSMIKKIMTSNGFMLVDINTTGETVDKIGKVDHIVFKFNYKE